MQDAIDFAVSQGGSGLIDELPSWYAFFTKYVASAEAVSISLPWLSVVTQGLAGCRP